MKMHEDHMVELKPQGESKYDFKKADSAISTEAQHLLSKPSCMQNENLNRAVVGKNLEANGVLPSLLVSEMARLDTNRDGYLSRQELSDRATSAKENPVTAATAQHALNHFEDIRRSGSWLDRQLHSSDTLSADQLRSYQRQVANSEPAPLLKTGF